MDVSTCKLTARDGEILEALTKRVRVLSFEQVARTWWSGQTRPLENTSRRLDTLSSAGLVRILSGFAHPELPLATPLLSWRPGAPTPDFGQLSYRLRSRWSEPLRMTKALIATKLAAAQFGGNGGRSPRPSELTHDLHLSALFLKLLRTDAAQAMTWQSEATQYAQGGGRDERLPDAIVGKGRDRKAVEFGGSYAKSKLAEFHQHCVERDLPYEVW